MLQDVEPESLPRVLVPGARMSTRFPKILHVGCFQVIIARVSRQCPGYPHSISITRKAANNLKDGMSMMSKTCMRRVYSTGNNNLFGLSPFSMTRWRATSPHLQMTRDRGYKTTPIKEGGKLYNVGGRLQYTIGLKQGV